MGGICRVYGAPQGVTPALCDALGLPPGKVDGWVRVSGDDWNAGYDLGILLTPTPQTRVGLSYRSSIHHDLSGESKFYVPQQAKILRKSSGALRDTGVHAAVDFPERVALGASHEVAPGWTLLADITWTHWAQFQDLAIRFDNPKQPTIVQPEGWVDSFRYSLGVRWVPEPLWTLRLGVAYDESTIPSATLRTPRIPDADRIWLAAGIGFRPFERVQFDVGYAHLFSPSVGVDNADPVTGHVLRGHYDIEADVIGVQFTWDVGWPPLGDRVTR
jgi:long-chain fatty acid transport protein